MQMPKTEDSSMKRIALVPFLMLAALVPTGAASAAPAGPETNPVGTIMWLPPNTNQGSQVPQGQNRLVVIYDRSLDLAGKPADLLANGAFGLKTVSNSPGLRMKNHSPHVDSIDDAGGDQLDPLDEVFAGVQGDIRDGDCDEAGTSGFSAAFSTTRTFLHQGATPYQAQNGPGACEVVEASAGSPGAFQTRVTTYVPGFWIDFAGATGPGGGPAQVWYTAVYDTEGESGEFYETADSAGSSRTVT
jgi:hypothetical protein